MYYKRSPVLTSIPERCESTEEARKWVPKNKHEVLKAKYKCLKKLFQIYDASVIGILPETTINEDADSLQEREVTKKAKRKQRSTRTKTEVSAGTSTTPSSGNITDNEIERVLDSTTVTTDMRDLKNDPCSCTSTQFNAAIYKSTQDPEDPTRRECECTQTSPIQYMQPILPNHYKLPYQRPKLTRFQSFMQRLFGIRQEYQDYRDPGRIHPASDNNITHYKEKKRRKGIRFRRFRKLKNTQSDSALKDIRNPTILSYVQSVQRNCLMDMTPRQCPITGCAMVSYGIINYNDHLNICHFTDRKYICHYCHEGFENEYDKYGHENEHLGITKLNLDSNLLSGSSTARQSVNKTNNTQTETNEVHEEKLKKIVSFFDKITNADHILSNIKKNRCSECTLGMYSRSRCKLGSRDNTTTDIYSSDGDKRTVSCVNLRRKHEKVCTSSAEGDSDVTSNCHCTAVACNCCGEKFDSRRQLSLHMDLEHRTHHKYSKFHSCSGIINPHNTKRCDMHSEDGQISIQSDGRRSISRIDTSRSLTQDTVLSRIKSQETLSCDPSTNIVYYTSMETLQPSIGSFVQKGGYKWEPGTKIIRV